MNISEKSFIDPTDIYGDSGMSVDLDRAKVAGRRRIGARFRTGTTDFMSIEVHVRGQESWHMSQFGGYCTAISF